MMTREETIEELERLLRHWDDLENGKRCFGGYDQEAVALALTALRPVSREQVEKVWKGEWIAKHYVDGILEGTNFDECSKCGYQRVFENPELKTKYIFCPNCGAPMTDEAVEMVMERMEEVLNADTGSV